MNCSIHFVWFLLTFWIQQYTCLFSVVSASSESGSSSRDKFGGSGSSSSDRYGGSGSSSSAKWNSNFGDNSNGHHSENSGSNSGGNTENTKVIIIHEKDTQTQQLTALPGLPMGGNMGGHMGGLMPFNMPHGPMTAQNPFSHHVSTQNLNIKMIFSNRVFFHF